MLDVSGAMIGKALASFNETGDQNILTASASGITKFILDRLGNFNLTTGSDIRPLTDSTSALNIANAAGTDFVTFDTTNSRIGIGTSSPGSQLTQTLTTTIPAGVLVNAHNITLNVSGVSDDLNVQGTRTLAINTNLTGTRDMATISGPYALTYNKSTAGTVTHLIGTVGVADNQSTGTVGSSYGAYGRVDQTGGGHVNNAYGLYSNAPIISAGTIDNYSGLGVAAPGPFTGAVVTRAYGAMIGIPTGATSNNIGLLVGSAPTGKNVAAYINGAMEVVGNTTVTGNTILDGNSSFNTGAANFNGSYVLIVNALDLKSNINLINKAGSAWLGFATKNSTGAENVYDLANIGTLSTSGNITGGGGMRLNTATAKPTCDSTQRGTFWVTQGATDVKDNVEVCAKDGSNAYAWRTLY